MNYIGFNTIATATSSTADISAFVAYFSTTLLGYVFWVTIAVLSIWLFRKIVIQRGIRGVTKAAVGGGRRGRGRRH